MKKWRRAQTLAPVATTALTNLILHCFMVNLKVFWKGTNRLQLQCRKVHTHTCTCVTVYSIGDCMIVKGRLKGSLCLSVCNVKVKVLSHFNFRWCHMRQNLNLHGEFKTMAPFFIAAVEQ